MRKKLKLLIADDDEKIVFAFKQTFQKDADIISAQDGQSAIEKLHQHPDIAFIDITMPKKDGLSVLKELGEVVSDIPIIIITGYGTMQTAIEAMQLGAFDYVTKPLNIQYLRLLVNRATEVIRLRNEVQHLKAEIKHGPYLKGEIIGNHITMQEIFKKIGMVAMTPNVTNVLITGESGTGKELVAKAIHKSGKHWEEPFLGINCSALPENLLESELFGHEHGSFTGAIKQHTGKFLSAGKGTIFLDEIGDMPTTLQQKLLRVIEEREYIPVGSNKRVNVHARFIAATNKDLRELMEQGHFREDLYFRLNVFAIHLPPLRDRKDDIPALVDYFIKNQNQILNRSVKTVSTDALQLLTNYDYPGNVRELQNIIISVMTQQKGDVITSRDIQYVLDNTKIIPRNSLSSTLNMKEARQMAIRHFEEQFLRRVLTRTNGNVTQAAELSGITRQSFQRLMHRYNMRSADFKQ